MRIFKVIIAAFIFLPNIAGAITVNPGDFVMLVERNLGIPVHPEAGDNSVSLRFGSNEVVKVLSIDSETGWLFIRSSDERSGWITERYVSSVVDPDGDWPDDGDQQIEWCPAKRSADPHPSGRLRIASWNMANLHSENGKSVYTGPIPTSLQPGIIWRPQYICPIEFRGFWAKTRGFEFDYAFYPNQFLFALTIYNQLNII